MIVVQAFETHENDIKFKKILIKIYVFSERAILLRRKAIQNIAAL